MAASKLRDYEEKRDFALSPEPQGSAASAGGRRFVIQKHAASRLHYDFRLEHDGVMWSWAVTRGPSLDPSDKRLAVRTEDHPVDYADFEGVIPEGYGAGTVMIWDTGEWVPRDDPEEAREKGQIKFDLNGARLTGGWALIRMDSEDGRENWLLVKERDDAAEDGIDPTERWTDSVVTGRDMDAIAEARQEATLDMPDFTPPLLATLKDAPPDGEAWLHEVKYDGYRIQALVAGDRVRLMTRNGKDWTDRYPDISQALADLGLPQAAIDGELVALDADGKTDFGALQDGSGKLAYYAFDLLCDAGEDLTGLGLAQRKARLERRLAGAEAPILYSDHIRGHGDAVIDRACDMALEGIVSKKADAPYRSGRQRSWIKSKCVGRDEFVIGGYRRSDKAGRAFSSLLLGEFADDDLVYRGRVGTGFSDAVMEELAEAMAPLKRDEPAFADVPAEAWRGAVWLRPRLVAEIAYTERTSDGLLRHPSFLGLRDDKTAHDVAVPEEKTPDAKGDGEPVVAGITISSAGRLVYPDADLTKGDVARWYAEAADRILTHAADRPASLVRCPEGLSGDCFFQKHAGTLPDAIGTIEIEEKDGQTKPYIVLDDAGALVAAAQMGMLEVHLWGARRDRIERPDRLVMDLDPAEGLGFDAVRDAAREVRDVLDSAGLRSFPLLTGGKGLHVVVPLERRQDWDEMGRFAKGLARSLAGAAPDRYVATASKAKREGRIFIDWLRNRRGATAIAPFSLRARPGAPVAVPVGWEELPRIDAANAYDLGNVRRRLASLKTDPWEGYGQVRQSITKGMLEALGAEE